jgi:hypothetical protein
MTGEGVNGNGIDLISGWDRVYNGRGKMKKGQAFFSLPPILTSDFWLLLESRK